MMRHDLLPSISGENSMAYFQATDGMKPDDFAPDLPCIYADNALSLAWANHNAKFYLCRIDSPVQGKEGGSTIPVVQVVMPADGFSFMTQFFVHRLAALQGHPEIRIEGLRAIKKICENALGE
jgi:hypothetical protein